MAHRNIAEAFPPGEFIKEEIDARGWTQVDLAEILGRPPSVVNGMIKGKRMITPALAKDLGAAFDTSPEFWMNLETSYRLFLAEKTNDVVARKARLFQKAPVKEMIKRNWIEKSDNIDVLEKRLLDFFRIDSLDEEPTLLPHAARKATTRSR